MTKVTDSVHDLQTRLADALRDAAHTDGPEKATLLRAAADLVVEARSRFFTADNEPDWRGAGWAYRQFIREANFLSGVNPADLPRIQNALRYHVSNALRDRLPADVIERLGLRVESARERSAEKRERYGETLTLFTPGGAAIETGEEVIRLAERITAIVGRVDVSAISALGAATRREVVAALENAGARLAEVADAARSPRRR